MSVCLTISPMHEEKISGNPFKEHCIVLEKKMGIPPLKTFQIPLESRQIVSIGVFLHRAYNTTKGVPGPMGAVYCHMLVGIHPLFWNLKMILTDVTRVSMLAKTTNFGNSLPK